MSGFAVLPMSGRNGDVAGRSNDFRSAFWKSSHLLVGRVASRRRSGTNGDPNASAGDGRRPGRHHCSGGADASLVVGIAHRVETPPAGPEILDHFRTAPTARRTVIQSVMPHGMTVAAVPDYKTKHRLSPRRSNVRTVPTPCFFRNGERLNAAMQRNTASTRNPPPPRPCPRSTRDHDRGWTPAMGVIENITKLRGLNQYIVSRRNSR